MTRPSILRLLRIAVSVVCGIVCLLLVALWVRSYYYIDSFGGPPQAFTSSRGRLLTGGKVYVYTPDGKEPDEAKLHTVLGVFILTTVDQNNISYDGGSSLPIAALVVLMGAAAASPWLRWRFSLRTLLLATTLVAVVLGLAVAMM
jgi:hypothetical protein